MGPIGRQMGMGAMPTLDDDEDDEEYSAPLDETVEEAPADGVPPEFASLYQEFSDAPSAKGLYDLISACSGQGSTEKPGGLALILGGKGKKL